MLAQIGVIPVRIASPDIDETPLKSERSDAYALRMATEKARAVSLSAGEVALAGDTVVAAGRRILPRAVDDDDVVGCLRILSGRRHHVLTAIAVVNDGVLRTKLSRSIVVFAPISPAQLASYVAHGEGVGKAGGYAIQGRAAAFVRRIDGSYSGIVGLPLFETVALLRGAGVVGDA